MVCWASGRLKRSARALIIGNVRVQARIAEIMRAGAERAEVTVEQVLRELAKIGFSDIRKAVAWRNEMVAREDEEAGKGEDGVVSVTRVLLPRVSIVPSEVLAPHLSARLTDNFTRPVVVHARVCVSLTHSMT